MCYHYTTDSFVWFGCFSKLEERKIATDKMNQLAENENGKIYTEKKNFLIVTNFYIHKTIHKTLTPEYIAKLDRNHRGRSKKTVFEMSTVKSPARRYSD